MNLEYFARNLHRLGATSIVLVSGNPVMLRFPTGDKFAQQTLAHGDLTKLLLETVPAASQADVRAGRAPAAFEVTSGDARYRVSVQAGPEAWKITIEHAAAAGPPAVEASIPISVDEPESAPVVPEVRGPSLGGRKSEAAPAAPARAAAPAVAPARPAHPVEARQGSSAELDQLLHKLVADKGSDVHLTAGLLPRYRVGGNVLPVPGWGEISDSHLRGMLTAVMPERVRAEYEETNDADFAYAIEGLSRFRCNVAVDRHGAFAVIRRIPFEILKPEQIGLPKKVLDLCFLSKGLVLVTGPTGSGKSTTLATMIDYINGARQDHIITIEDPVEFVHPDDKKCLIRQREVGEHTGSFKRALKAALREDPNIVLVGEMRDLETIAIAIETAETGHLVFGTLHTSTAPSTVDRIIDQFPADRQEQIRVMLSESLRGVVAQTLCKKIGGGRVAAYEILIGSKAVSNLIREGKTFQLYSIMQTQKAAGNVTLSDSLMNLVKQKIVEPSEAYMKAVNKEEFRGMLDRAGIRVELPTAEE